MLFRDLRFYAFWLNWSVFASIVLQSTVKWADASSLEAPLELNPRDSFSDIFVRSGKIVNVRLEFPYSDHFVRARVGGATYIGPAVNWSTTTSTCGVDFDEAAIFGFFLSDGMKFAVLVDGEPEARWAGKLISLTYYDT